MLRVAQATTQSHAAAAPPFALNWSICCLLPFAMHDQVSSAGELGPVVVDRLSRTAPTPPMLTDLASHGGPCKLLPNISARHCPPLVMRYMRSRQGGPRTVPPHRRSRPTCSRLRRPGGTGYGLGRRCGAAHGRQCTEEPLATASCTQMLLHVCDAIGACKGSLWPKIRHMLHGIPGMLCLRQNFAC